MYFFEEKFSFLHFEVRVWRDYNTNENNRKYVSSLNSHPQKASVVFDGGKPSSPPPSSKL